jgi:Zinc dependent phospholipase C
LIVAGTRFAATCSGVTRFIGLVVVVVTIAVASDAPAYAVFAHEANVDALWDSGIRPLLERRYPRATREQLQDARAYAYGGSVIQDLGYYPFGSRFFSNLLHYVRTGDFIESMLRNAQNADEYAFALGALAHYAADNTGHPEAVNRSVALMYPKLRAKFGDSVTYAQARAQHVIVEFSFDIVQVAAGAYAPDAYHRFIGFEVSKPALERAFKDTYALAMRDVFLDQDLAFATYRHTVSEIVPELTRVAWQTRKDEIARLTPGIQADAFIYQYTRRQYEQEFGAKYRKPGFFARFIGLLYRVLPKFGPLRPLRFKTPSPEAERLFSESFRHARARYAAVLNAIDSDGRVDLVNTDFDTGRLSAHREYELADRTYFELLEKLADRRFSGLPRALHANITSYYAKAGHPGGSRGERKRAAKIEKWLAAMKNNAQRDAR